MTNVPVASARSVSPQLHESPSATAPPSPSMDDTSAIEAILDLARWAPSGDNTQPWRFEIVDGAHAVIHGFDTRDHCVYDLDGRPSQMSIGALIETAAIAASAHGLRLHSTRRTDKPATQPTFDLHFDADPDVRPDSLLDLIKQRSVQRRPFATTPLTSEQKTELEASLGSRHTVRWLEGSSARRAMAALLFRSARLRLVTPEAYRVHRDVIEWDARFSVDKVPDQALGVNRAMLGMMRFAMHSWERVRFFNRFLAGTWMPRIQMDFLPALACGAHLLLLGDEAPRTVDDHIAAGRAMQRFWLTATRLGLQMQPEMTPLIFGRYGMEGRTFTSLRGASEAAQRTGYELAGLLGEDAIDKGVFMARIGQAPQAVARSLRMGLPELRHRAASGSTCA